MAQQLGAGTSAQGAAAPYTGTYSGPATGSLLGVQPSVSFGPRVLGSTDTGQTLGDVKTQGNETSGRDAMTLQAPASAFQRLVYETTGRLLPIYGEAMLSRQPVAGPAPVAGDYEVAVGDELTIRATGGVEMNVRTVVDRDGQVTLPTVGTFPLAGVKARDLDSVVNAQIGKMYRGFSSSVSLGKLSGLQVFVAGQALTPGLVQVSSASTLSSVALSAARPGPEGSLRQIQLRRGGQVVSTFDVYELLKNGRVSNDRRLQPGDVIFVAPVGPRVALNVESPSAAIFELKPGDTLADVLSMSGTSLTLLRQDYVLFEGFNPTNALAPRTVRRLPFDRALQAETLRDGDVITVFSASAAFENAVTLKGNVADPARYPYTQGMRLSDLIPSPDVLVTRQYFKKKNNLVGFDKERAERLASDPRLTAESLEPLVQPKNPATVPQLGATVQKPRQDYAVPLGPDYQGATSGYKPSERYDGNPRGGERPVDGRVRPEAQIEVVEQTIRNLADQINWDYAVIERFDRQELRTVLIPFNLRKAIAKDKAHDFELKAGDVVTVFSVADADIPKERKPALIKVTGEVLAPGFYQVNPGESLRDVLVRAGGVSANAFLYGTNLTRVAMKAQQEKQLQVALDQAERLLFASQAARSSSTITAVDAANLQSQQEGQRQYLAKLRNAKPDGRVVLSIKPTARALAELPPVVLEDGDTIHVPSTPGQVAIFGSVYSQGAYAYQPGRTVFDYLDMAGGASKTSDKGSIFVLRANGTVESAQQGWLPLLSGLTGSRALPGDAIYVPEDFNRVSLIKTLVDVSQVFYQIGLGAAAIKVLQD